MCVLYPVFFSFLIGSNRTEMCEKVKNFVKKNEIESAEIFEEDFVRFSVRLLLNIRYEESEVFFHFFSFYSFISFFSVQT